MVYLHEERDLVNRKGWVDREHAHWVMVAHDNNRVEVDTICSRNREAVNNASGRSNLEDHMITQYFT